MLTNRGVVGGNCVAVLLIVLFAIVSPAVVGCASDTMDGWLALYRKQADKYEFKQIGDDGSAPARRISDPILRWSQPVRIGEDGLLFLWVANKRPVAAVAVFSFKDANGARNIVHECSSLATTPLSGDWHGKRVWHPAKPALEFRPVPDSPVPAETAPARLRQMQAMARQFTANTVRGGRDWELRLLSKPLYRYESARAEVADGALFALAQGTDPELFLLFEAQGDSSRWKYAIARFSDLELHVRHKDREVFSVPYSMGAFDAPYLLRVVVKKNSETPTDFEEP